MSNDQAQAAARLLTLHPVYGDTRFRPESDDFNELGTVEVVPGLVYRFPQYDASKGENGPSVTLTIYLGLGDVGRQLWEQEVRVLQRIGTLDHPALPEFLDGGQLGPGVSHEGDVTTAGVGYIRSLSETASVADGDGLAVVSGMHSDKSEALTQFWKLADGLSILHDSRISHRNLWPGTLEFTTDSQGERGVILSRFEMSSMISNLLRRHGPGDLSELVRHIYDSQPPRHLLFCPPERLAFVFRVPGVFGDIGLMSGDTFSLGMIVAEWFIGHELFAGADLASPEGVRAAHERARATIARTLPLHLRTLLMAMTETVPRERWEMARVVSYLDANFETVRAALLDEHDTPPHVVAYMKGYSDQTLLKWKYLTTSTDDEAGQGEIEDLLVKDMRGAQVAHSPDGANGFVASEGSQESRASAKTVVFGQQLVWFCGVLRRFDGIGDHDISHVRVVKFVMEKAHADRNPRLQSLRSSGLRRCLFAVVPIEAFGTPMRRLKALANNCSDWSDLERTDVRVRTLSAAAESYLGVLQWYLEFQRAQLDAGTFAYRIDPNSTAGGSRQLLRWDHELETLRRHVTSTVAQKFLSQERLRTAMPDHFADAVAETPTDARLIVFRDRDGRMGDKAADCRFIEARGVESIVVEADRPLPPTGWIRLASDRAARSNIERQVTAVAQLADRRLLVQQLVAPRGGAALPDRWRNAGGTLEGEGRAAVLAILTHETMFALQGPPGTGKTEVTSQAVVDHLEMNPGSRLLVSAQAHNALDNLGQRILRKLGGINARGKPIASDWVVIRVASDATRESVDDLIKPFLPTKVVERLVRNAQIQVREWLTIRRVENSTLADVLTQWLGVIEHDIPGLRARTLRGANIVMATTGSSTKETLVDDYGAGEPFDWVLVEEAAKAWPTELAMPLVHGHRWTLIGDHAQIGAFNRQQVEAFLLSCREDTNKEVADWYDRRDEFNRAFDTFGSLFARDRGGSTMELTEQYRMNSAISAAVSTAFYANRSRGGLVTKRKDQSHGLHAPRWLQGHALIWLDTENVSHVGGNYYNEYEADVVSRLVRSMHPQPGRTRDASTLAVLTPYRQQKERLQRVLGEHMDIVHTIDGFQGREADIVVASLVRDQGRRPGRSHTEIGHLREPSRANVMLSRARNLLVVVGRMSVYADTGSDAWDAVVEAFRTNGAVVPVSSVMPS